MTDIRDLKPLMDVFPWELVILAIAFFLAALAVFRKVTRTPQVSPMARHRKSRSIQQRLDLLKHKNLSPAQLCEALGDIMRDHLRLRYGIPCHRLTTDEILVELQRKEAPEAIIDPLSKLLEACDLVKFAKWQPRPGEIDPHLTSAYWVLEKAREVAT